MEDIAIKKLNEIISELDKIKDDSYVGRKSFERMAERAKAISLNKWGPNSLHEERIKKLEKRINDSFGGFSYYHPTELKGLVQIIIDEIEMTQRKEPQIETVSKPNAQHNTDGNQMNNTKVFIVHGHNDTMKLATARTLEKLGLKPIILHEQANAGDTIIEKFTRHSDVGFAVVLLSADDFGYPKTGNSANARPRARQNVIFELGFFFGKLGRKRVVAIVEQTTNFEKPSDVDGVVYVSYNSSDGEWQFKLAQELLEVGYPIDSNVLIRR